MDNNKARPDTVMDENAVQHDGKDVPQNMSPDLSLLVAVPQTQLPQEQPQHIHFASPPLPTTQIPPPTASTPQVPIEFRIARSGNQEFQQGLTQSAIEVLLENPRVPVRKPQQTRSSPCAAFKDQPFFGPDQFTKAYPRKIRIRSAGLLILLEDLAREAGHSFSAKDLGSFNDRYIPTVSGYNTLLLSTEIVLRSNRAQRYSYTHSSFLFVWNRPSETDSWNGSVSPPRKKRQQTPRLDLTSLPIEITVPSKKEVSQLTSTEYRRRKYVRCVVTDKKHQLPMERRGAYSI
jgi:hypothetical protein